MILINSASEPKTGTVRLENQYSQAKPVFGNGTAAIEDTNLHFSLGPDESTVVYLQK